MLRVPRRVSSVRRGSSSETTCTGVVTVEVLEQTVPWALRELGDYGAVKGIEIWMEVHGQDTQNPPVAAAILKACGHRNVGACWNSNPTDVVNGSVKTQL